MCKCGLLAGRWSIYCPCLQDNLKQPWRWNSSALTKVFNSWMTESGWLLAPFVINRDKYILPKGSSTSHQEQMSSPSGSACLWFPPAERGAAAFRKGGKTSQVSAELLIHVVESQQLSSCSIRHKAVAEGTREVQPGAPKGMGTRIRVTTISSREKAPHLSAARR